MKPIRRPAALLSGLVSLALLAACQTDRSPSHRPTAEEQSVKPGINKEFLKPDLNVSNWVERFEKEGREIYDQREKIVAAAKIRPGAAVADIGAGTGLFTPMLAARAGPTGKVYAVDIVPNFLDLIETRCARAGIRNVQTVLCTERSVELPQDSINQACICDVYHHFEYPQHSLASLHRALRRDGEVFLIDFKRIPGVSSDWVLDHVRAGQEVVTAEFEAAGFKKVEDVPLLKDNYAIRFRKMSR
jgi:predicted methyltransferase